jgi:ADP-heptose:LPS heptosyltransferase
MPQDNSGPETVLVYVGLDLLGDGLMKLPFLRALRHAWPAARVTWLAGKGRTVYAGSLAPLVDGLIDEVIENAGIGNSLWEVLRRPLPDRSFDLVLDSQRRLPTTLVLRRIRHRVFVSGCADYWLSDVRPPRGHAKPPAMVDQMLELLSLARTGRVGAALDLGGAPALPGDFRAAAAEALPEAGVHVMLVPGAGGREKCWPLDRFIELAQALAAAGRVPVFLLGPGEQDWRPRLAAAVPGALIPDELAGAPVASDPVRAIALAARCAVCVANDSGGGHICAAAGAPLVSLFGPTPAAKFAPRAPHLTVIAAQDFGGSAMTAIPVDAALRAVEAQLQAAAA